MSAVRGDAGVAQHRHVLSAQPELLATLADVFVFVSHLTVPADDRPELERHFRTRSGLVDDFPGFLYLQADAVATCVQAGLEALGVEVRSDT